MPRRSPDSALASEGRGKTFSQEVDVKQLAFAGFIEADSPQAAAVTSGAVSSTIDHTASHATAPAAAQQLPTHAPRTVPAPVQPRARSAAHAPLLLSEVDISWPRTAPRTLMHKRSVREYRGALLHDLDKLVPQAHRTSQPIKSSGRRACGTSGRSLHNILADTMAFIKSTGCMRLV